jgi:hypothetical protein
VKVGDSDIMSQQDFDEALKQYNMAMIDFFKGNPEPLKKIYSSPDDISLSQLSGPFMRGRKKVIETAILNAENDCVLNRVSCLG